MAPSFEHQTRNAIAALWGSVSPLTPLSTPELRERLRSGKIRNILLIRPHQGLGDLILATPVFRALKERYPECALHFLGSGYNVAAVQGNPRLAKTWLWKKTAMRNPARCAAFFRALRRERFDLALVLFSNAPSFTSFLIARLSGAAIIGSCATGGFYGGTNWSRRLTHWQAPPANPDDPEYLKFFAVVAPVVDGPCPSPEFSIPEEMSSWAQDYGRKIGLTSEKPPVAMFLGGNPQRTDRLWPPAAWAQFAKLLEEKTVYQPVAICPPRGLRGGGGVPEGDFYAEFRRSLGHDVPVFDEPGLPQAAAFLKRMQLFICPDGGLFHIAAAAGVRTLGLFFSSDPERWVAPVSTVSYLRAPGGRPDRLTAEEVFEKAIERLKAVVTPVDR